MPKKKLTKAQVKRKLKTMKEWNAIMLNDKVYHQGSYVPMSVEKMFEFNRQMNSALKRIK
jgi:ATP-dependent Clp protease adapter protein ClpS